MHADHSSICKFESEDDDDYRLVWQEIQALVDDAVENSVQLKLAVHFTELGFLNSLDNTPGLLATVTALKMILDFLESPLLWRRTRFVFLRDRRAFWFYDVSR